MQPEQISEYFIETSNQGIWAFDEEMRTRFANRRMAEMIGCRIEEMDGARLTEFVLEADAAEFLQKTARHKTEIEEPFEFRLRRKDGTIFDALASINRIFDKDGDFIATLGIFTDLTARKKTPENINSPDGHLRLITDSLPALVAYIDADHYYRFANETYKEWFGLEPEQVVGKHVSEVIGRAAYESVMPEVERVLAGEKVSFERRLPYLENGFRFVQVNYIPDIDDQKNVKGYIALILDNTERKLTEETLSENQMTLALAMQSSRMGAWRLDLAAGIVFWSEELEEIFGLEKGSFAKTENGFYDLVHEDDRQRIWAEIETAIAERRGYVIEFRFYHADGSIRWMEGRGQAVYSEKGEPVRLYGIGMDITERKRAEQQIAGQNRTLEALAMGGELREILALTTRSVETVLPDALVSILLADAEGRRLFTGFAESLPAEYNAAIEGLEIGEGVGSCGTAGFRQKFVVVSDIESDSLWKNFRELAETHHLAACWSFPIVAPDGKLLGTFAVYFRKQRAASEEEISLLESAARVAGIAIRRKQIEERLNHSQRHLQMTTEAARLGTWEWNTATGEVLWSAIHKRLWGYEPTNAPLGYDEWARLINRDDLRRVEEEIGKCLRGETDEYDVEYRIKPEGKNSICWIRSTGKTVFGEKGEAVSMQGVSFDITDRKQAQEALIEAERKAAEDYQALLQRIVPLGQTLGAARDLISIYRAILEFIRHSMSCSAFFVSFYDARNRQRTAAYIWGEDGEVKVSELPPMPLTEDGGPNSQAVFSKKTIIINDYWDFMKTRAHVILQEDGINPMSSLVVPMMIKNEIIGTLEVQARENEAFSQEQTVALEMAANLAAVAIENVRLLETEQEARQQAELRWRESEILETVSRKLVGTLALEKVTEIICQAVRDLLHSDGATFVLHEQNTVRYADENAIAPLWKGSRFPIDCCISGWSILERQPVAIRDIYQDERIPFQAYRQTFVKSLAMMPVGPDDPVAAIGAYWASEHEATKYEIGLLKSLANLSDLALSNVNSYEEMRRARQEAEDANRAKDEFLSVLSHELRTPLNSMLGWVRMLQAGMLDEQQTKQAIEVIERNTLLQNSLIEDLLDVSRIISGKMRIEKEEVDLAAIVQNSCETLRPVAEDKNILFECVFEDEPLILEGDAVRLQQVISNLVQNAVKFTAEGNIIITLKKAGDRARLIVKDTGIGIEPDVLPHIFERFRQADASTRRSHSGLGLGLTIVSNLVELHGGSVKVESEGKGRGSTFTVELPLAEKYLNKEDETGGETLAENNVGLEGARILLVDDDEETIVPLEMLLEKEKAEVVKVFSADEALTKLTERHFHVLVSDIGMPETDGYDLIAKIRKLTTEQNAFLPAIALTAYASNEDRRRALSAGFQMHFSKPFDFENLLSAIIEMYNGSRQ